MSANLPVCVPDSVNRAATVSPSTIMSSTSIVKSLNAVSELPVVLGDLGGDLRTEQLVYRSRVALPPHPSDDVPDDACRFHVMGISGGHGALSPSAKRPECYSTGGAGAGTDRPAEEHRP